MKIELLYFEGCPNHVQALDNLKSVLKESGLVEEIDIINVTDNADALARQFLGSPSIRIDGRDLEDADHNGAEYSMKCRRYRNGDRIDGYPPKEMIAEALKTTLAERTYDE